MSFIFLLKILFEVMLVVLLAYGIWHEEELVEFERWLWAYIKHLAKGGAWRVR